MIISAEYRLLPESSGSDIHEDVTDFSTWIRGDLHSVLSKANEGLETDLERVIAWGESAGGTLAIQLGFYQPAGFIRAVIAAYPGLAIGVKRDRHMFGAPLILPHVLEDFLKNLKAGEIVTSADPPARMPIALSLVQHGRTREFYGEDDRLYPMKVLEKVDDVPYVLIIHGENDTAVPVGGSIAFADALRRRFGKEKSGFEVCAGW
jgi:acetyl esterase/lipase